MTELRPILFIANIKLSLNFICTFAKQNVCDGSYTSSPVCWVTPYKMAERAYYFHIIVPELEILVYCLFIIILFLVYVRRVIYSYW